MSKSKPFNQWLRGKFKSSKGLWVMTVLAFLALFGVLFTISVMGNLRVLLPYLPEISGFPFSHRQYLLVFQNNQELRPTGGFISSFATVKLQSGVPYSFQVEDVYGDIDDHEYIEGPYPMTEMLKNRWYKGYSFRDGNFNANFPQTAEELIRLYHLTRPKEQIDGVIAINFSVLEDLVRVLDDVGKYTADNLFEEITDSVNDVDRHNEQSLAERKSVLKPLAGEILAKIARNPFKIRKVSDSLAAALRSKEIQIYIGQSGGLQQEMARQNWNGAWPKAKEWPGDFLAVVVANLGGMKSDRYLQRQVEYKVRISTDNLTLKTPLTSNLKIRLKHWGIENIPLSGPYSAYLRAFNESESGKAIAEQIVKNLLPGEEITFEKKWEIPFAKLQKNADGELQYQLWIERQSGTGSGDNYVVVVELPRGYSVREAVGFQAKENIAYFEGKLDKDQQLSFVIGLDKKAPRLIKQVNPEPNRISLHFNEDLNLAFSNDPFSYSVRDLDIKNPKITDQIKIKEVKVTSKDIELILTGQSPQSEERYGVTLRGLRDLSGNVLSEREITVVQRPDN